MAVRRGGSVDHYAAALERSGGELNDEAPLVRGHTAWARGRIGTEAARQAPRGREAVKADAWTREEIGGRARGELKPPRLPVPVAGRLPTRISLTASVKALPHRGTEIPAIAEYAVHALLIVVRSESFRVLPPAAGSRIQPLRVFARLRGQPSSLGGFLLNS